MVRSLGQTCARTDRQPICWTNFRRGTAHFQAMCPLQGGSRLACFASPPLKILKVAARRAAPYEASTSINNNILQVSGWLTVSHFGTGFLMTRLGLGLVWLGLAAGAFVGISAFSNGSAWFGLGLGLVWLGLAAGAFDVPNCGLKGRDLVAQKGDRACKQRVSRNKHGLILAS